MWKFFVDPPKTAINLIAFFSDSIETISEGFISFLIKFFKYPPTSLHSYILSLLIAGLDKLMFNKYVLILTWF